MNSARARRAPSERTRAASATASAGELVVIGKDILELLSSAMYIDPLSIYREYVQNAADAIDDARETGLLPASTPGEVRIMMDTDARTVRLRDNGSGIPTADAARVLLSIGASGKRGRKARGFRGIGRLAGLAYCRELVFRTRTAGDAQVAELRWDCVRLRTVLRSLGEDDDLPGVVDKIVTLSEREATSDDPAHFLEVELRDVVRHHRGDALMNEVLVAEYLQDVAPLPFDEGFAFGAEIRAHLAPHVRLADLDIRINDSAPLRRAHRDQFPAKLNADGHLSECELLEFQDRDGGVSAVGWILHHEYLGALPQRARIKGARLRAGDVQVGDERVLEEHYPEPRFNSWTVAEIHVVDPRIVPNARRDQFEHNVHFSDLTAQFEPIARQIARRCRNASIDRNRAKALEQAVASVADLVAEPHLPSVPAPALLPAIADCVSKVRALLKRIPQFEGEAKLDEALARLEALTQNLDDREPRAG